MLAGQNPKSDPEAKPQVGQNIEQEGGSEQQPEVQLGEQQVPGMLGKEKANEHTQGGNLVGGIESEQPPSHHGPGGFRTP